MSRRSQQVLLDEDGGRVYLSLISLYSEPNGFHKAVVTLKHPPEEENNFELALKLQETNHPQICLERIDQAQALLTSQDFGQGNAMHNCTSR